MGHVTEAKSRSKESPESNLGIAFDRISMKDGHDLPIHATVQAIGRALNEILGNERMGKTATDVPSDAPVWARNTMGTSSRPGGTLNPAGTTPDPARSARDPAPSAPSEESAPAAALDPQAHGVVGLKGLSLSSSDQGSLISSTSNNVHLDGGTQLILRTE